MLTLQPLPVHTVASDEHMEYIISATYDTHYSKYSMQQFHWLLTGDVYITMNKVISSPMKQSS